MAGLDGPEAREEPRPDASTRDAVDDCVIEARTNESELRSIRRAVDDFITREGGDPDLSADFQLAACELATNVMQHSTADVVTVALRRDGGTWQLDVSDAEGVPEPDRLVAPPTSSTSGRGLMIVRALMDDVRLLDEGVGSFVRCTRHVG